MTEPTTLPHLSRSRARLTLPSRLLDTQTSRGDGYVGGGYVLDGWAYLVARWTRSPMQLIAPTTPTTMRTTLTAGSGKYAPAQL